ncbi:hypothetical protein HanIR_Chr13g0658311 [Helianthus annuus]|nr:hypothetical protein HanIR_Chr13g0658311 [Helianthus annuus]
MQTIWTNSIWAVKGTKPSRFRKRSGTYIIGFDQSSIKIRRAVDGKRIGRQKDQTHEVSRDEFFREY